MNEHWDSRMMEFLRRTSEEIKSETQRLVSEVRDPAKQQKVKAALKDLGVWAKKTAEEAADMVETAVRKAETALKKPVEERWRGGSGSQAASEPAETTARVEEPTEDAPHMTETAKQRPAKKTIGRKSVGTAPKKSKPSSKTMGRKKT
jgi:hypothetical protein